MSGEKLLAWMPQSLLQFAKVTPEFMCNRGQLDGVRTSIQQVPHDNRYNFVSSRGIAGFELLRLG
jgi:hypothetical protein